MVNPMADYQADRIQTLVLHVGETITLESLRQAVVPPYLMLLPFLDLPEGIVMIQQDGLDEDGLHGCVYTLKGEQPLEGRLRIGFRDLQTNTTTHEKSIAVQVHGNSQ